MPELAVRVSDPLVPLCVLVHETERAALREAAHTRRATQSSIVRDALRESGFGSRTEGARQHGR